MKALTFEQFIALLQERQKAERLRQKAIALEQKQKPFAEIKGTNIRIEICVN